MSNHLCGDPRVDGECLSEINAATTAVDVHSCMRVWRSTSDQKHDVALHMTLSIALFHQDTVEDAKRKTADVSDGNKDLRGIVCCPFWDCDCRLYDNKHVHNRKAHTRVHK